MRGWSRALCLLALAGCAAHSSSKDRFVPRKDIPASEGCLLDVDPCPLPVQGCAQYAACTVLSFWRLPPRPVLDMLPSDRGVTILELATILRREGLRVEIGRDGRHLQALRSSIDQGVPLLLVAEVTAGADIPLSPILRTRGNPHYLVATGYDTASKRVICLGLDTAAVAVPTQWFKSWWKRTDYAFLKMLPAGDAS